MCNSKSPEIKKKKKDTFFNLLEWLQINVWIYYFMSKYISANFNCFYRTYLRAFNIVWYGVLALQNA